MENTDVLYGLVKRYENNQIIKPLIQLIPMGIGSAIDTAIGQKWQKMIEGRLDALLDEMNKNKGVIGIDHAHSENYIHCFMKVVQLTVGTRRYAKIRMFARLLNSVVTGVGGYETVDEFEEYLSLLEELSYREMEILLLIEEFQETNGVEWVSDMQNKWKRFTTDIAKDLNLSLGELDMVLMRLNRIGCSETFFSRKGGFIVRHCIVTPMFKKLKNCITSSASK